MVPRLVAPSRSPFQQIACKEMMLLFFLLSFLADIWASHLQATGAGGSVALFDNYHGMENLDIPLDENTKRAVRFTVELGCHNYARHHSTERYESDAITSRVHFSNLESALQMFFPGCKVADLEGNFQEHVDMASIAPSHVVTTVGKYGTGFYTHILSPFIWIRFDTSQPKASAHLREFVERNSKHFDILYLQVIQRHRLAKIFSLPDLVENVIGNDISTSQAAFRYAIAHTVQSAFSATAPELYKKAIYERLSSYFSAFELRQYVFSPNVSYVAKAPAFAVYKRGLPLMFYTNESKLLIKGCIPVHFDLYGPLETMGMIVASFPGQVFAIYFKGTNAKKLGIVLGLSCHFAEKLKTFDLKDHDRFLELFEKTFVD